MQRWLYCQVPNGSATVGFLAAHPFGFYVHVVGRISKPCRLRTTGGALQCPYCHAEPPTWKGYTPFYSREYRRMFVMISQDTLEATREIPLGSMIKIGRDKDSKAAVVIRPDTWRTLPLPPAADREGKVDMVPFLLRLWKDEELLRWHVAGDSGVSPATVTTGVGPTQPCSPEREAELMRGLIRDRITWPGKDSPDAPGPQLLGDVLNEVPVPNGRHKKR